MQMRHENEVRSWYKRSRQRNSIRKGGEDGVPTEVGCDRTYGAIERYSYLGRRGRRNFEDAWRMEDVGGGGRDDEGMGKTPNAKEERPLQKCASTTGELVL